MKNRNIQLTAILFVIALALAPIVQAVPSPDGGPTRPPPNEAPSPDGGPIRPLANDAPEPDGGPAHQSSTARANANREAIPEGETLPAFIPSIASNGERPDHSSWICILGCLVECT